MTAHKLAASDDGPLHVRRGQAGRQPAGAGTRRDDRRWQRGELDVELWQFRRDGIQDRPHRRLQRGGLAANLLYLTGSEYGERDESFPGLSNVMLAQYVLDSFASVEEALEGLKSVQVSATEVAGRTELPDALFVCGAAAGPGTSKPVPSGLW